MKKRKQQNPPVEQTTSPARSAAPPEEKKASLLETPEFHILLLVILAVAAYSNTFRVPFIFDDEGSIQLNQGIHGLTNFFAGGWRFLPNRVLGYFSFALNYQLSGLDVTTYHIVNLLIHIITAQLAYAVTRLTFSTPRMKGVLSEAQVGLFALSVALLFVSHPIQTQAITYIVQRLTSLCTLFYLASLTCYLRWRLEQAESLPPLKGLLHPWYLLSLLMAILAMKTKEIAFTLPVVILLYEWIFFGRPAPKLLGQLVPLLLTLCIIPVTLYNHVSSTVQNGGQLLSDVNAPVYNVVEISNFEYFMTQFSVILTYIRLLFLPVAQNLDYDYPISRSLAEPKTFLSLLVLLLIFAGAVYLLLKSRRACTAPTSPEDTALPSTGIFYRLAAFGIFWFFITLSVESSIIKITDVIFEHRLYLPSFGFFLTAVSLSAAGVTSLARRQQNIRPVVIGVMTVIVLTLSGATFARNSVWNDWLSIWGDTLSKSPDKPRPNLILGIGHYYLKNMDKALKHYQDAARLKPDYIEAYYNMGLVYKALNQHAEAVPMFLKVLSISAFSADMYAKVCNEIGTSYAELGNYEQAEKVLADAVKNNPDSTEYRNNYAYTLYLRGNRQAAIQEYQTILSREPGNIHAQDMIKELNLTRISGVGR